MNPPRPNLFRVLRNWWSPPPPPPPFDGPWKAEEYRDVLETWVNWWNGPGREGYRGFVVPPLSATNKVLYCIGCAGIYEDGARCKACGRDMSYQR